MKIVGIICEYNPFHLGHQRQMDWIRQNFGEDCAIVCLMSGNFVQRGHPAILDKSLRAAAALASGADLVLELPVTAALSSAEGFAAGGVEILSGFCHGLCFGSETGDGDGLMAAARALLSPEFSGELRLCLEGGLSFPAARQAALERMGVAAFAGPNDILAVEYCKAILARDSGLRILPLRRNGSYHALEPDPAEPSATALRLRMLAGEEWAAFVPGPAQPILERGALHSMAAGERGILQRLRTMTDGEFEALPYGTEGLWRKFMHACRREATLEGILTATKSKRYTRSRLDRMAMCAFLGITDQLMRQRQPYTRILGFTDRGRGVLRTARENGNLVNAGEAVQGPWWELEQRCGDLYGLFRVEGITPPGLEAGRRVVYHK